MLAGFFGLGGLQEACFAYMSPSNPFSLADNWGRVSQEEVVLLNSDPVLILVSPKGVGS